MSSLPSSVRRLIVAAVGCWCLWPVSALAADKNAAFVAAMESITPGELKQHVEVLADDSLEGRQPGTAGSLKAAEYLRARFKDFGLPGGGANGEAFQPFAPNYRNVLVLLKGSDPELQHETIVVGAHYDHVGYGTSRNSRGPIGYVHNGADDNASGTSAVLELAEAFTILPEPPSRSILFAMWDAEEKGLLGSKHWLAHPTVPLKDVVILLNLDMIGRLRQQHLTIFGSRTGYGLRRLVSRNNERLELKLQFSWKIQANADYHPFFTRDVPVLMFHTGMHNDYHRPTDDAKLINSEGMRRVVRLMFAVMYDLANCEGVPAFRAAARQETPQTQRQLLSRGIIFPERLGVACQKGRSPQEGAYLTQVTVGSPADIAGLRPGDRIVQLAGREIHTADDLSGAVTAAANPVALVVRRPGQPQPLELTAQLDGEPKRLGINWRLDGAEPGTIILNRVIPGSPAARADLRVGDRIYRIADREFADDSEFAELARTLPGPLKLLVERDGQLSTVEVQLDSQSM